MLSTIKTVKRLLHVTGRTWQGGTGTHTYTLRDHQKPDCIEDAKLIAGDFEYLTAAELELVETVTVTASTVTNLKTRRECNQNSE